MSLINDALKRASQTEKNRPREAATVPSNMQAVSEPRRSAFPIVAIVCIVALLAAACALVLHYFSHPATAAQTPVPAPVVIHPVTPAPPPKIEPTPTPAPTPQPVVVTPPPDTNPPTPPPQPQPVVVSTPPPPVEPFPDLKLQGIFYNAKNPRAAINGLIKREHEQIGDVTIIKISQNAVTVQWNGQTKDLNLGGQ